MAEKKNMQNAVEAVLLANKAAVVLLSSYRYLWLAGLTCMFSRLYIRFGICSHTLKVHANNAKAFAALPKKG